MAGEKSLDKLLQSMSPVLVDGDFVFCSVKNSKYGDFSDARPIASFVETEGLTLVLLKNVAEDLGLAFEGVFRCISLEVHSSLEAVGLTAAISARLASQGIAANMIAAYYHDHIFVQDKFAERAFGILSKYDN